MSSGRFLSVGLVAVGGLVMSGCPAEDPEAALRRSIGLAGCDAANGAYRGQIVDVTLYEAAGQDAVLVYVVVDRNGQRSYAPPANTTVAELCAAGQP